MTRLLVLGALHHDVVVDAPRLPRLDETLPGTGVDTRFGGKGGNQAMAAARMGAAVAMAGRIGDDATGQGLLAVLGAAGIDHSAVAKGTGPTGMSVAITNPQGDYGAVIVSGANLENDGQVASATATVALIQNEIPVAANRRFAAALPGACRLIWNAAPARAWDDDLCARCDLLVVNRVEAGDMVGTADSEQAVMTLFGKVRGDVVVTLGGDGALTADAGGLRHCPARRVTPVSTHGAGDMFTGALAAQLMNDRPLADAVAFAQAAAGLFVAAAIADRAHITRAAVEAALRET